METTQMAKAIYKNLKLSLTPAQVRALLTAIDRTRCDMGSDEWNSDLDLNLEAVEKLLNS